MSEPRTFIIITSRLLFSIISCSMIFIRFILIFETNTQRLSNFFETSRYHTNNTMLVGNNLKYIAVTVFNNLVSSSLNLVRVLPLFNQNGSV